MEGVTRYTLVDIFSVGLISVSVCVCHHLFCMLCFIAALLCSVVGLLAAKGF